jgi:2-polyprenyl-3-methyl-5-hydroxy-6-metoxy-1,4-benzoquinol methylase
MKNKTMLINRKPKELLSIFLEKYTKFQNIEIDKALELVNSTKRYYNGKASERDNLVHLQDMENNWYESLNNGIADYSVYDSDYYFTDLWACWTIYSRSYLRSIVNKNSLDIDKSVLSILNNVKSLVDLGCGIGYTTAALQEIFKDSKVYATNIEGTKQYNFCNELALEYGFKIVPDVSKIGHNVDLVFASEYFEHIFEPLNHLQEIIDSINPSYFIIANSFNTRSIGHFYKYKHNNEMIDQKNISRIFNKKLLHNGYKKLKTKIWNDKPSIWVKTKNQIKINFKNEKL